MPPPVGARHVIDAPEASLGADMAARSHGRKPEMAGKVAWSLDCDVNELNVLVRKQLGV